MNEEQAKKLRAPFPPGVIGKLPRKGKRQDGSTFTVYLDYVGHAATVDRLLEVDPDWTWTPVALDDRGLPAFDTNGGLWINLTVAGVTRLGYGDAQGKSGPNAVKEAIGDAIRNGAMRFGVALDLWSKEDLHAADQARADDGYDPGKVTRTNRPDPDDPWATTPPQTFDQTDAMKRQGEWSGKGDPTKPVTQKQKGLIRARMADKGITDPHMRGNRLNQILTAAGRPTVASLDELSNGDMDVVLAGIDAIPTDNYQD